ncbi:MAG: hypothetical protein FJ314_03495 [SAR202 cluster bacterium]|nr:hypothetical protein [SAR202 cluster bacterium]
MPAQPLGRIDRQDAAVILGERKLYVAALLYPIPGAPQGYTDRLTAYWKAIDTHVAKLEARAGVVKHIFHEGVADAGESALEAIKEINPPAMSVIKSRIDAGAEFEALENDEAFAETVDWSRCAQLGFMSRKVADVVSEAYRKATEARFNHMRQAIEETLGQSEAGLLIAASTRGLQLSATIHLYNVVPPELDELMRWLRDASAQGREQYESEEETREHGPADEPPAKPGGSKLWVPGT